MAKKSNKTKLYCYKGHYIWKNLHGDDLFTVEKNDQRFETLEAAENYIEEKYFKED